MKSSPTFVALLALSSALAAQIPAPAPAPRADLRAQRVLQSPFLRLADHETHSTVAFDGHAYAGLRDAYDADASVRLEGFALPEGELADLVLTPRRPMPEGGYAISMTEDGEVRFQPQVAIYAGYVEGGGSALLAVSPTMLNGYVIRDGETFILSSGGPTQSGSATIADARAFEHVVPGGNWCREVGNLAGTNDSGDLAALGASGPSVRTGDFFFECDPDLRARFDTDEECADYTLTLVAAVSEIYRRDVGAVWRVPSEYLRVWNVVPPWGVVNDFDGLTPIRNYWADPVQNPLFDLPRVGVHVLTRPVFGGVAFVSALCSSSFGVALSSVNGSFPTPSPHQSPGNWDPVVVAHEGGHNHGSGHTFDYNPPIGCSDGSGPDRGTIMSYCHLTGGGVFNVGLRFHPRVQPVIINRLIQASCYDETPIEKGDYDYDGDVDYDDLVSLFQSLNQGFESTAWREVFDMNLDGNVDQCDIAALDAVIQNKVADTNNRNGAGNPRSYVFPPPQLGATVTVTVELSMTGHTSAWVFGFMDKDNMLLAPGQRTLVDLAHPAGEVLELPVFFGTPDAELEVAIPCGLTIAGLKVYTQAMHFGGGQPYKLTNAQDITFGY